MVSTRHYHDLLDSLKREVESNRAYITSPQGIGTFDDYKFYIGMVHGLNIAIEKLIEQTRISQDD